MSAIGGKGLLPPRGILPKACPMKAHEDHSALIRLVAVELSACGMTLESLCDTREGHVARQYTIAVVTPKKKAIKSRIARVERAFANVGRRQGRPSRWLTHDGNHHAVHSFGLAGFGRRSDCFSGRIWPAFRFT